MKPKSTNPMSGQVSLAVITTFLAFISPATAVAPYLDITLGGGVQAKQQSIGVSTNVSLGPLVYQESVTDSGSSAFAACQTAGISIVTLPDHPGRLYYQTEVIGLRCQAQKSIYDASSNLYTRRSGVWRFDALPPRLNGVNGFVRMTYKVSWDLRRTTIGGAGEVILQVPGSNKSHGFGIGNLLRVAGSTTEVTENIPVVFGNLQTFQWNFATSAYAMTSYVNYQTNSQGACELWSVEVFDAGGQKLTRFVDYEWYELSGPTAEPQLAASSQDAAVPLRLNSAVEGSELVLRWPSTRPGDLYQVDDLAGGNWQPATQDKTLDFDSWGVRVPMNQPLMFFRLKAEGDAP